MASASTADSRIKSKTHSLCFYSCHDCVDEPYGCAARPQHGDSRDERESSCSDSLKTLAAGLGSSIALKSCPLTLRRPAVEREQFCHRALRRRRKGETVRLLIALIVIVYLVDVGVALAPTVAANWSSATAAEFASRVG
jgi:hypothetical protein